jgi:ABC-type glutathione transport system ATPase component
MLELRGVSKTFHQRGQPPMHAVQDVSLTVRPGETLALVGESGSGKTTLARIALHLLEPDSGEVWLDGRSLLRASRSELRAARLRLQPVFQDSSSAFNPRRTVRAILRQVLTQAGAASIDDVALCALLQRVELRPAASFLERYPNELSGGQRQRLAVARAIAPVPQVIVADEPLSGADVSIRAQLLNLLVDLQEASGVAYLLITHDILLAQAFTDRIAVMQHGRIVEQGDSRTVFAQPAHGYTRLLIEAVQSIDAASSGTRLTDHGADHRRQAC